MILGSHHTQETKNKMIQNHNHGGLHRDKKWLEKKYRYMTIQEIANVCKIDYSGVHYWFKKYNIPIRKTGEYPPYRKSKIINHGGYKKYSTGIHKNKFVHRVKMEKYLGRKLKSDEMVHHIDGNKTNNTIKNLVVLLRKIHNALTNIETIVATDRKCLIYVKKIIEKYEKHWRHNL